MPYPKCRITAQFDSKPLDRKPTPAIKSAAGAARVLRRLATAGTLLWLEEVIILCLDSAGNMRTWERVALGGLDEVTVDVRVIAAVALTSCSSRVIIGHNHPAGDLIPSVADLETTIKVRRALEALKLELSDHIIFSKTGFFSFRDSGMLPVSA